MPAIHFWRCRGIVSQQRPISGNISLYISKKNKNANGRNGHHGPFYRKISLWKEGQEKLHQSLSRLGCQNGQSQLCLCLYILLFLFCYHFIMFCSFLCSWAFYSCQFLLGSSCSGSISVLNKKDFCLLLLLHKFIFLLLFLKTPALSQDSWFIHSKFFFFLRILPAFILLFLNYYLIAFFFYYFTQMWWC